MRCCFVFSAVCLIGLNTSASATDLSPPFKSKPEQPAAYSRAFAPNAWWAGFYLGNHIGGNWANFTVTDVQNGIKLKNAVNRAAGGGHFGYNRISKGILYGAEVDLGGMNLSHSARLPGVMSSSISSGLYGDVTGRIGYPIKNLLPYGKGGFAFYQGGVSMAGNGPEEVRVNGLNGWTVGGGFEFRLGPAWSAKAEYQYFQFGGESMRIGNSGEKYDSGLTAQSAMFGFNYHPWNSD